MNIAIVMAVLKFYSLIETSWWCIGFFFLLEILLVIAFKRLARK